jgi:hypothetical protein
VILTARERNFDEFKSGGLHEKHAVATWNLGTISAFAYKREENQENLCHSTVTSAAVSTDRAENTISLLLITGYYLSMSVVQLLGLRSLPSNGSTFHINTIQFFIYLHLIPLTVEDDL